MNDRQRRGRIASSLDHCQLKGTLESEARMEDKAKSNREKKARERTESEKRGRGEASVTIEKSGTAPQWGFVRRIVSLYRYVGIRQLCNRFDRLVRTRQTFWCMYGVGSHIHSASYRVTILCHAVDLHAGTRQKLT